MMSLKLGDLIPLVGCYYLMCPFLGVSTQVSRFQKEAADPSPLRLQCYYGCEFSLPCVAVSRGFANTLLFIHCRRS